MVKKMNDDDVMNYVYSKLFGDLDGIESHSLFDDKGEGAAEGTAKNAEPESKESGGMKITIEPLMAAAQESAKPSSGDDDEEDEMDDIAGMSPLMAQLHGKR